jgi:hypothetical protein
MKGKAYARRRSKKNLDLVLGDACQQGSVPQWTADGSTVFVDVEEVTGMTDGVTP